MCLLVIDTSLRACGVAVSGGAFALERMERGQEVRLIPLIGEILEIAHLTYKDLKGIVVAVGPGSFTGIRIGLAAAMGLGLALSIPIFGASTLEALGLGPDLTDQQQKDLLEGQINPADPRLFLEIARTKKANLPLFPLYLRPPGIGGDIPSTEDKFSSLHQSAQTDRRFEQI